MAVITFSLILSIAGYIVFFLIISSSAYYMYCLLTSKDERQFYRLKLSKDIAERKNNVMKKELNSSFQQRLEGANIKFLNAFRYQMVRVLLILYIAVNYVLMNLLNGNAVTLTSLMVIAIAVLTEPKFKFSLINLLLNLLIKRKQKSKIIELFTLFDILKADLNTLNEDQEVNVYSTIKDVLPMFKHIQGTLSKFLSVWKKSPELAKEVFHNEIGGDSAKTLSAILYKLDNVSKQEALRVIESESSVFSRAYYQKAMQQAGKENTVYFGFFLTTNILVVVWLIVFISLMITDGMNQTF